MLRDCQTGGENDRLGAGAYRRSHRCLRHSISAVGPQIPSTEAAKTARAGPFTSRQTSSHWISWMLRRSSAAVATSREGHRFSHEDRPQLPVAVRMLRLRTIYRAENIGNVLKRVVNVCQREFVNGRPHTLASPGGGAMSALVSVLRQFAG